MHKKESIRNTQRFTGSLAREMIREMSISVEYF